MEESPGAMAIVDTPYEEIPWPHCEPMAFQEKQAGKHPGWMKPIRELGVTIAGTHLEAILEQFKQELQQAGIKRLQPSFYLSDEWGVPFDTTAIAIPFYLARS